MWSWTRWIENRVVNVTQLWYNQVALLCSDGISNHLFACEAEPDECEIKLLSLLGSGIVELFCNLLLPSTDQLLMQFSSSFSEFFVRSWCYLSIISSEKLIFFFEIHREFYCVGKNSCRYYKILLIIMYVFVREEFSFNRLYYLYFGIFLNECYVSRLGLY